jgi:hypothetical protein
MREIQVLVTLQVDECDPGKRIAKYIMESAAAEAVENAIRYAEADGFSHGEADNLSIGFVKAEIVNTPLDEDAG